MSIFSNIGDELAQWWKDHMKPWVESLLANVSHEEMAVLLPLATQAAGAVAADLATNSGNLSAFAEQAAQILKDTAAKAEQQAIVAGGGALLAAVSTAIIAHTSAVPLGGVAPPPPPPPAPPQQEQNPPVNSEGLRIDGPTLAEWVAKGYSADAYPPVGYAAKSDSAN